MNMLTPFVSRDPDPWSSARFVLINAAQIEPACWEDFHPTRVVPASHQHQASLFPALLDAQTWDEAQRAHLRERAHAWERQEGTPYAVAWMSAAGPASSIVTHLVHRMSVRHADGREDVLRYYDPWVFRHLRGWLLTPEQMDSLLGPIQAWHWREPDGTWHTHTRNCVAPSLRPLRLTAEQWPSLRRMAELQFALTTLARLDPLLAWQPDTAKRIDALLGEAKARHGMHDRADRLLYALQAARFHPSIHTHPLLRQRLNQIDDDGPSYVELCTGLDDAGMQQLASELETSRTNPS
ncbi:DUF4123 domain-containing protein [Dyella sp. M7H15-1]|uniref:DUF4123 domain-containing protein n=1 Tax=Dyella sp. M7H15-1 TaxID=2501295 RepID=UPI0010050C79|nr:DUF4123 domain-containing protein [Dyella sp. M7H15-1]QAU24428.1 DUF4123 domain-containing protein [Dyella sp. M7H15-1]